jgi:hypothetical protein
MDGWMNEWWSSALTWRGWGVDGVGDVQKWRKVVCFVVMRSTEPGCFKSCSWCLWKALDERRGAWAWFHQVWTCSAKVLEYWMISSLKLKLNCNWKFQMHWNVPLVWLERSWWAGFNGIYLVIFGFRMWEILILKWFSAAKNSNKFQKTRFLKEKSIEDVVTLGPMAQATLVFMNIEINFF